MPKPKSSDASRTSVKSMSRRTDSAAFLLVLHLLFLAAYVLFMPAFEGADEPEHLRYIEALYNGERVHPVDASDPRRYGIEVYQPPLYYRMAALAAKPLPMVFPDHLAVNPDKNPNRPFLVHDGPGERFPFDAVGQTLRFFRLLSLLLGLLSFLVLVWVLRLAMPESPSARAVILLIAALWPNHLQVFSAVSNDSLVFLFSLCLMVIFLKMLKSDGLSLKHGALFGITLALGIWSKMTILLTAVAMLPVFGMDALMDRSRFKGYIKMVPAVLLPALLLSGPYFVSRTIWYDSLTGQGLLHVLVPSVLREVSLSAGTLVNAMARILPGRFLADLCWQQLTLPFLSLQLFLLWTLFNALLPFRTALSGVGRLGRNHFLMGIWVSSSFLFIFIALLLVFSKYVHVQIRHAWNLWPVTLLAPYFLLRGLNSLKHINTERILRMVFAGVMVILVGANCLLVYNFMLMCKPAPETTRADLDYFTYMDNFAQSRYKADAYLDLGYSSPDKLE